MIKHLAPVFRPETPASLGLDPWHIDFFRQDPEVIELVRRTTGYEIPIKSIDDVLIIQLAGMVESLGLDGAEAKCKEIMGKDRASKRWRATVRGFCMKMKYPKVRRI